jgi:transposase
VFVAVLGASNYTFAEARWSEGLADWIGAHVDALAFLGGVPKLIVCDNLKAGVTAACRYEPGINRTYQDMAAHYGTSILPARVRRPRDKAKVENGVLIVERFILARLRNRQFFSLEELNQAIRELLDELNARLMRKLGASRRAFFEALDLPALKALPDEPYQYAEWKKCRVAPDYHVDLHGHLYSVPHALIREVLEARMTGTTVELFHRGKRVASHARSALRNRHTTISEHMPSSHRRYAEWTPARIAREAEQIGPASAGLCAAIMRAKPHPEQGFRACLGILRLAKSYGGERLEAACRRGLDIGATTYGSIASILKSGLDRAYREEGAAEPSPIRHANIRGGGYYH